MEIQHLKLQLKCYLTKTNSHGGGEGADFEATHKLTLDLRKNTKQDLYKFSFWLLLF